MGIGAGIGLAGGLLGIGGGVFILPAAVASFVGGPAGARIMSTYLKGKSIRILFSFILFFPRAKLIHGALG